MSQSQEELNAATAEIDRKHSAVVEGRVRATAALHHGARVGKSAELKAGDLVVIGWLPDSTGGVYEVETVKHSPASEQPFARAMVQYKLVGWKKSSHCSPDDWMIFA